MDERIEWNNSVIYKWKLIYITIISWVILAIIFGLMDLQISIVAVNWNNIPGNLGSFIRSASEFGADYGEGPSWGLIFIAFAILIGSYIKDIKKQKIPTYILFLFSVIILILGIILTSEDLIWYGGFISCSLLILILISNKIDFKDYRNLALIIIFLAIINPLLFVNITKPLCGRVRFRDLSPGYIEYTPWFLPPGPDFDNLSFPSGLDQLYLKSITNNNK
ncbi:MAG: hypothetical protein ACTSPY_00490 [Candidatus Helarchaeota archaeon]